LSSQKSLLADHLLRTELAAALTLTAELAAGLRHVELQARWHDSIM